MQEFVAPPPPRVQTEENPHAPEKLTESQQKAFDEVFAHFSKEDYKVPGEEKGSLKDEEKYWLSYECMLRYLRATKWKSASVAIDRLEATLKWRREFGLYDTVNAAHVEPEGVTGKQIVYGYDVDGRPALYLVPSRQNTTESPRQIQFVFWYLERVVDLMGPGIESLNLMINFADRAKNPSFSTSRAVLNILQTHYPEHLGRAIIINIPFLLNAFFSFITPFVDPVTRPKMKFNCEVVKEGIFTPTTVWKQFGGEVELVYEHEKYWPSFVEMTSKRRATLIERWKELGGTVGLKEWDIRMVLNDVQQSSKEPVVDLANGVVPEKTD